MTTPEQAWAILARHARDDMASLRLQELCSDNDRISSLVAVHNGQSDQQRVLILDLSRQRMTLDTVNHLLRLANARGIVRFLEQLAWGQNDAQNPVDLKRRGASGHRTAATIISDVTRPIGCPTMHMALRAPMDRGYQMLTVDGKNALTEVHKLWDRLQVLSES